MDQLAKLLKLFTYFRKNQPPPSMRRTTLLSFLCFLAPVYVHAAITLTFTAGALRDETGTTLADDVLAMLVADSDGDGEFPTIAELTGTSVTNGGVIAGDRIMRVIQVDSAIGFSGGIFDTFTVDYTAMGVAANDRFALYWFPNLNTIGATISNGELFGFFADTNVNAASGGDIGMIFPADDGQAYTAAYYESDIAPGSGIAPDTAFRAIPEPSSVALGLMGLAGACMVRRRKD